MAAIDALTDTLLTEHMTTGRQMTRCDFLNTDRTDELLVQGPHVDGHHIIIRVTHNLK